MSGPKGQGMTAIYTIGYEGARLEDLIATLHSQGVARVLDVREIAQSRRPGFSKRALSEALAASGIGYTHDKRLGDPKNGREAARAGRLDLFQQIFERHLEQPSTLEALSSAAETVSAEPTALLCFERNPKTCHRTLVAQHLAVVCSLSVRHLGVVEHGKLGSAPRARAA